MRRSEAWAAALLLSAAAAAAAPIVSPDLKDRLPVDSAQWAALGPPPETGEPREAPGAPRAYRRSFGPVRVDWVEAPLGAWALAVGLPREGTKDTVAGMARARGAAAGINFSFFDPPTGALIGPVIVDGRVVGRGSLRRALLAVDSGGRVSISRGQPPPRGARQAAAAGPLLLAGGRNVVHPSIEEEAFSMTRHFLHAGARSAVGLTADGRVLFVLARSSDERQGVTFSNLADILRELGAVSALAADGGSSSTLYHGGRSRGSGKRVANALLLIPAR